MAQQQIVELIEKMALPFAQQAGLELVDIAFVKEGGQWYLRIFIDKPGGVGLEDCGAFSHMIDKLLDEKDPISQSYTLEVSSPGVDRPLKKPADYSRFAGKLANITTFAPHKGKKKFTGRIIGIREDNVVLDTDGSEMQIPLGQVASARLKVEL